MTMNVPADLFMDGVADRERHRPPFGKGREDLVSADQRGGVLRNSNWRARALRNETFPTITPRDSRHTAASLAVSAHADVKAVPRMLGHAKASMTLDIYQPAVADRLDAAIKSTADALRTAQEA